MAFNKSVGINTYLELMKVEEQAKKIGFKFARGKHNWNDDFISLQPLDDNALPIYVRDASLFLGDLGQVESFLRGVEWARDYDRMLKVSDSKKRERKEQDERNRRLVAMLKEEKVKDK